MPVWIVECVRFGLAAVFFALAAWTIWSGYQGAPQRSELLDTSGVIRSVRETTDNDVTRRTLTIRGTPEEFVLHSDQPGYGQTKDLQAGQQVELQVDGRRWVWPKRTAVYELRHDGRELIGYAHTARWAEDTVETGWCLGVMWAAFGLLALRISGIRSGSRLEQWGRWI